MKISLIELEMRDRIIKIYDMQLTKWPSNIHWHLAALQGQMLCWRPFFALAMPRINHDLLFSLADIGDALQ